MGKRLPKKTVPGDLFRGSYCDGHDVDILEWAGVELTAEEQDIYWDDVNPVELIEGCLSAEVQKQVFNAGRPAASDVFYLVTSDDPESFKKELAAAILNAVGRKAE